MKKILLLLLFSIQIAAQDKVYEMYDVDSQPVFPGGVKAFMGNVNSYFKKALRGYNELNNGVDFVVEKDGTVSNLTVIGNTVPITEDVLRAFQRKTPTWEPAHVKGKPVRCHIRHQFSNFDDVEVHHPNQSGDLVISEKTGKVEDENTVYSLAALEIKPEFPGGIQLFHKYLAENFKLAHTEGVKGRVFVSFVIEKDGSLTDIKVLRDFGFGSGKEAVRVLKSAPKWKPGMHDGRLVRTLYTFPITYLPQIEKSTQKSIEPIKDK